MTGTHQDKPHQNHGIQGILDLHLHYIWMLHNHHPIILLLWDLILKEVNQTLDFGAVLKISISINTMMSLTHPNLCPKILQVLCQVWQHRHRGLWDRRWNLLARWRFHGQVLASPGKGKGTIFLMQMVKHHSKLKGQRVRDHEMCSLSDCALYAFLDTLLYLDASALCGTLYMFILT